MLADVELRREARVEDDLNVRLKHDDDGGACWCDDGAHQDDDHDDGERECEQTRAHVERWRRRQLRALIKTSEARSSNVRSCRQPHAYIRSAYVRVVDINEFTRRKFAPPRVVASRRRVVLARRRLTAPAAISIQIADRRRGLCLHAAAAVAAKTPHAPKKSVRRIETN